MQTGKGKTRIVGSDWSEQRAKEGLTRLFEVIGLAPGTPRHEALEIACTVDHVVTDGPPRFAARTRSALLATDVALTPFQPSPSGEGPPVEIRKLLEKACIFLLDNQPVVFVLNRYGPRNLIAPESAKALAEQDLPTPCEPRRPARGVRECCVQQSVRMEAAEEMVTPHGQMIALAAEIMSVAP